MSEQITIAATFGLKGAPKSRPGLRGESWKIGHQGVVPVPVLAYKIVTHLFEFWANATGATIAQVNEELTKLRTMLSGLEMIEEPDKQEGGFTLVELLIVLGILGLVVGAVAQCAGPVG